MKKTTVRKYDAGVYAVVSRKTGAMYIGASCELVARLDTHRSVIENQTFGYQTPKYKDAFAGHAVSELEFRILERIEMVGRTGCRPYKDPSVASARKLLNAREKHWIEKLNPCVNIRRKTARIGAGVPVVDLSALALAS